MMQKTKMMDWEPKPDFDQLLKVLWGQEKPDYVPFYELYVSPEIMSSFLGKPVPDRVSAVEFYHQAGYDYVPVWPAVKLTLGSLVDTTKGYPITDRDSFRRYCWPDQADITFRELEAVTPVLPVGMKMIGQTGGPFEMAEALCGYENLCMLLMDDRALVHEIFEQIGIIYETMYSGMAKFEGVGAIVISDDLGFKTQTLIPPQDIREFISPIYKKLTGIIHAHNKPCILHSCGNLLAIMDDLISLVGIDAKHSYEDVILPVTEAFELYGDRISILGGFDVDRLCRSSENEIRAYVDLLISKMGQTGRYALGSGNSIARYVPIEKYLAMLDQGWRQRLK